MTRRPLVEYHRVLDEHRARLNRLLDRRGIAPMKRLYDEAAGHLTAKLRAQVRRAPGSFTAHQHRVVLSQLRQGQALISRRLAGELGDLTHEVQKEAVRGVVQNIAKLEHAFTGAEVVLPLEEAARFRGIIDQRRTSLLKMHESSMARYGARAVGGMERSLSLSLITGESPMDALDSVQEIIAGEWWQAERIVRTESAWAFNALHSDAIEEINP